MASHRNLRRGWKHHGTDQSQSSHGAQQQPLSTQAELVMPGNPQSTRWASVAVHTSLDAFHPS